MNRVVILFTLIILGTTLHAQTDKNPYPKTISVTGSAELEIVPDEIYVQVDLKEYDKKGQPKISIDKIKEDFLHKVKSLGLPDSSVTIAGYDGDDANPWNRKKNKKEELFASISYQVKLKTSKQMDDLVNLLDDNATQNFMITRTEHSKMTEFRKQLKIQAIKSAKDKAKYLAEAIDEKIGEAISINEQEDTYRPFYNYNWMSANSTFSRSNISSETEQTESSDFRKIKFRYEVSVSFALK